MSHMWTHDPYDWVIIWLSHVSHINVSVISQAFTRESSIRLWVMSQISMCLSYHRHSQERVSLAFADDSLMSHVTHIYMWDMSYHRHSQERVRFTNESCHTHERVKHIGWVKSHVRMSMSHIWERHTRVWVMSHIRMSHVTHTNESCHVHSLEGFDIG